MIKNISELKEIFNFKHLKDNSRLKKTIIILLVIFVIFAVLLILSIKYFIIDRTKKFVNNNFENFFVNEEQYNEFINSIEGQNLLNSIEYINNELTNLSFDETIPTDYESLINEKKFKIGKIVKDNYKSLFESQF